MAYFIKQKKIIDADNESLAEACEYIANPNFHKITPREDDLRCSFCAGKSKSWKAKNCTYQWQKHKRSKGRKPQVPTPIDIDEFSEEFFEEYSPDLTLIKEDNQDVYNSWLSAS